MRKRAAGESFVLEITLANGQVFYRDMPEKQKALQEFEKTKGFMEKHEGLIICAAVVHTPQNALDQSRILATTDKPVELRENLPKGLDRQKSEHMARVDKGREVPSAPEKPKSAKQAQA